MGFTKNTLGLWAILWVFPSMPEGLLAAEKSTKLSTFRIRIRLERLEPLERLELLEQMEQFQSLQW